MARTDISSAEIGGVARRYSPYVQCGGAGGSAGTYVSAWSR